jgi:hypothetical protein
MLDASLLDAVRRQPSWLREIFPRSPGKSKLALQKRETFSPLIETRGIEAPFWAEYRRGVRHYRPAGRFRRKWHR